MLLLFLDRGHSTSAPCPLESAAFDPVSRPYNRRLSWVTIVIRSHTVCSSRRMGEIAIDGSPTLWRALGRITTQVEGRRDFSSSIFPDLFWWRIILKGVERVKAKRFSPVGTQIFQFVGVSGGILRGPRREPTSGSDFPGFRLPSSAASARSCSSLRPQAATSARSA